MMHTSPRFSKNSQTRKAPSTTAQRGKFTAARLRRRRLIGAALFAIALLMTQSGGQAAPPAVDGPLTYSRGFQVTGDFIAAGIRTASGDIQFTTDQLNEIRDGVDRDADIVGAFLYWETIHSAQNTSFTSQASFRGQPLSSQGLRQSSFLLQGNTANCWGAATSIAEPKVTISRADVLHLLPKRLDTNDQWTGKYVLSGSFPVSFPDGGTGNLATQSGGGTLVLVYSHPGLPLKKLVMYDGAYPKPENTAFMQTLRGFYQSAGATSRIAYLAGVGGNNATEQVSFNGVTIASNPFTIDSGSGRTWNTKTYDLTAGMPGAFNPLQLEDRTYGERVTTTVTHSNVNQGECEAFGAILFSVQVLDDDNDGLPDGLEDPDRLPDPENPSNADNGVSDPDGRLLPNLYAMGARLEQPDLIAEFNAMQADAGTTYGTAPTEITDPNGHHHMPSPEVLKMVGDVYLNKGNIRPHFDVGNPAAYYAMFCGTNSACITAATAAVGAYLVPGFDSQLTPKPIARGGEMIEERTCTFDPEKPTLCQFPDWPGTVSYPLGLQLTRDAPVANNGTEITTAAQLNAWAAGERRRRFDLVRRDFVHYLLYAHARATPRSPDPCLDSENDPTGYGAGGTCDPDDDLADNPQYHIPSSASGIAALPGPDVLITLGLWDPVFFTATPFVQASTTVHELGHNFYLWHGGWPADFGDKDASIPTSIEPNCKPNYLSSMSYMFQVHGLWTNTGQIELNYSGTALGNRNETSLTDSPITSAAYRPAWFAPFGSMLAQNQGAAVPAARFCNGAKFDPAAPAPAQMARVMAASTGAVIDWDGDGDVSQDGATNQDVNFDGPTYDNNHVLQSPELLRGFNDWENIHLDQVGVGRNVTFFTSSSGVLTLDAGSGGALTLLVEAGSGNVLTIDSGSGVGLTVDAGSGVLTIDLGSGSLLVDSGSGVLTVDLGSGGLLVDSGSGVLTVDLGSGDRLLAEAGSAQAKELTLEGANETGRAAPSKFDACVIGTGTSGGCPAEAPALPLHRTYTSWTKPTFGTVAFYHVSRRRLPTGDWEILPNATPNTFYIDTEELPQGVHFLYRVQAEFDDGAFGPHSNTDEITATNDKPFAVNDPSGFVTNKNAAKVFPAPGMLVNDTDTDSAVLAVPGTFTTAKGGKVVIEASGKFTYTPKKGTTVDDTFTYTATNGKWSRDSASSDFEKFQMNAPPLSVGTVTIKIQ